MGDILPEDWRFSPEFRVMRPTSRTWANYGPGEPLHPERCSTGILDLANDGDFVYDPDRPEVGAGSIPRFDARFEGGNIGPVRQVGDRDYAMQILPDSRDGLGGRWFYFRVMDIPPGEYRFTLLGLFGKLKVYADGLQMVAQSDADGTGWFKLGDRVRAKVVEPGVLRLSVIFTVPERAQLDSMSFALSYPYTFTDVNAFMAARYLPWSKLGETVGGLGVPAVLWDADRQAFCSVAPLLREQVPAESGEEVELTIGDFGSYTLRAIGQWGRRGLPAGRQFRLKPVIVIAARVHPSEVMASYAMEGVITRLFGGDQEAGELLKEFTFLLFPMMNPDGVVCGFGRGSIGGPNQNRVWSAPDLGASPEVLKALHVIAVLAKTHEILASIDLHGDGSALDAFSIGFGNQHIRPFTNVTQAFDRAMGRICPIFNEGKCRLGTPAGRDGTMCVNIRRRFNTLFSYTLETSVASSVTRLQFTPVDYRQVGWSVVGALYEMFMDPESWLSAYLPRG
jgi:hypothetical protein